MKIDLIIERLLLKTISVKALFRRVCICVPLISLLTLSIMVSAMAAETEGQIAFSTQESICIMNLGNKIGRKSPLCIPLPKKTDCAHHPSWMPDGKSVLFEYSQWSDATNIKRNLAVLNISSKAITNFNEITNDKGDGVSYPKWSPCGRYMAFLKYERGRVIRNNASIVDQAQSANVLNIYDKVTNEIKSLNNACLLSSISWSADSTTVAFVTHDDTISIYNLSNDRTISLIKGLYPVFHPTGKQVYYTAPDKHLYRINIENSNVEKVDNGDWSWCQLIDISGDGTGLFYIRGSSFLMWEYSTINFFIFDSKKEIVLSKKYAIIHGASLYDGHKRR